MSSPTQFSQVMFPEEEIDTIKFIWLRFFDQGHIQWKRRETEMKPCLYSSREMVCCSIWWCMDQRIRLLDCSVRNTKSLISTWRKWNHILHGGYRLRILTVSWIREMVGRWSNMSHLNEIEMMHWSLSLMWGPIQPWVFICYRGKSLRQWCWMEILIPANLVNTGSMIRSCLGTSRFSALTKILF